MDNSLPQGVLPTFWTQINMYKTKLLFEREENPTTEEGKAKYMRAKKSFLDR